MNVNLAISDGPDQPLIIKNNARLVATFTQIRHGDVGATIDVTARTSNGDVGWSDDWHKSFKVKRSAPKVYQVTFHFRPLRVGFFTLSVDVYYRNHYLTTASVSCTVIQRVEDGVGP